MSWFLNHHRRHSRDVLGLAVAKRAICTWLLVSIMTVGWAGTPEQAQEDPTVITKLSLEDLMNAKVTSVSKKEQKLSTAPSAIYVITQEDIRRSGLTNIPELLRMVPGLDVARVNANRWAISSRGFNAGSANKLLVLVDGRSVYSPTSSGVYWDVQDMLLDDIERIEVIRGPGGTLWGANAVNGVINIITKSAKDTQGGLITGGFGSEQRGLGGMRYGGTLGHNANYRVYAKYFDRDNLADSSGQDQVGRWDILRGGFRMDWKASGRDSLTVQGDIYNGTVRGRQSSLISLSPPFQQTLDNNLGLSGENLLARLNHTFKDGSSMTLQTYYDRATRTDDDRYKTSRGEIADTFDLDFQHHFTSGQRHDIVWGLGYRFTSDHVINSFSSAYDPPTRATHLFSAFIQDEISVVKDRLRLVLGSKLEHDAYSGFEAQPSIRLLWAPRQRHTFWTSVSRAVRTPARTDRDLQRINSASLDGNGLTNLVMQFGNPRFKSEDLLAYEAGYRVQPTPRVALDFATFYNVYNHLRTSEPGVPFLTSSPEPLHRVIPYQYDNRMHGRAYGIEMAASWHVTERWKLSTGYTWLQLQLHRNASSRDSSAENAVGDSPKHQVHLRSFLKLPHNFEFDTTLYYVGRLANQQAPSYTRLDTRFGWHPLESLEISAGLQNMLDPRHPEFGKSNVTQIKRSIYGKILWRF